MARVSVRNSRQLPGPLATRRALSVNLEPMNEKATNNQQTPDNGSSGRYIVASLMGVCAAIFGAAAAIMDPSATRVLMTVAALAFVVLSGALLGAAMARARSHG